MIIVGASTSFAALVIDENGKDRVVSPSNVTTPKAANTIEGVLGGKADAVAVDNGMASKILGFMQWIGYAIAVGMLMYIGIKYVTSAADERANLKGSLVKYVIGAVLISGAVTVIGIISNIGNIGLE